MAPSWAGDVDYDTTGHQYARRRRTDPRIAALVHAALGDARTVINVGAGAGSYEPEDRTVFAVEPSAVMRGQRVPPRVPAIIGVAEALPFDDQSFDAGMAMLTVHQWTDWRRGLAELRRVTRGPTVVLTFDGSALNRFWLADYAPELIAAEQHRFQSLELLRDAMGGRASDVQTVPIPIDCVDGFTEACYARPEQFLDAAVRGAQSAWGFVAPGAEARFVEALRSDLAHGTWDRRYAHWRHMPVYEGALRLLVAR